MKYDLAIQFKADSAQEYLRKLISERKHIELREMKLKRSLDQNGLYWLWLTCIMKEVGIDKDECHLLYRAKFLQRDEEYITNLIRPETWNTLQKMIDQFSYFPELKQIIDYISYSTTDLDTKDFTYYLNKIREHAREYMSLILLTLDDQNFEAFYREYGFY